MRQKDWYSNHCSIRNCEGTMDKSKVGEADAVVFHLWPDDWKDGHLPWRSPHQHYVAWIYEPASYR